MEVNDKHQVFAKQVFLWHLSGPISKVMGLLGKEVEPSQKFNDILDVLNALEELEIECQKARAALLQAHTEKVSQN